MTERTSTTIWTSYFAGLISFLVLLLAYMFTTGGQVPPNAYTAVPLFFLPGVIIGMIYAMATSDLALLCSLEKERELYWRRIENPGDQNLRDSIGYAFGYALGRTIGNIISGSLHNVYSDEASEKDGTKQAPSPHCTRLRDDPDWPSL